MRPHLCDIIYIPLILFPFRFRNQLNIHSPRRILTILNWFIHILARVVSICTSSSHGLIQVKILYTLISFKSILDEKCLTFIIYPLISISTVSIHMSVSGRGASIGVHDGGSMNRLRHLTEEIPHCIRIKAILNWMRLKCMKEIRCLHGISKKENWKIYSHHIIISVIGVQLHCETSYISEEIRWTSRPYSGW